MKKFKFSRNLSLVLAIVIFSISLTGCNFDVKKYYKDVTGKETHESNSNANAEDGKQQKVADENINDLINSVKVISSSEANENAQKHKYDRGTFVANQRFEANGKVYTSIRRYTFENSIWNDGFSYKDPYNNNTILTNDKKAYRGMDYDHIVPLANAFRNGAYNWTDEQRQEYANDPFVGVCVNAHDNRVKSDKGLAEWMPKENKASYCYSWLKICQKYNLSVTEEDMVVIKETLKDVNSNDLVMLSQLK